MALLGREGGSFKFIYACPCVTSVCRLVKNDIIMKIPNCFPSRDELPLVHVDTGLRRPKGTVGQNVIPDMDELRSALPTEGFCCSISIICLDLKSNCGTMFNTFPPLLSTSVRQHEVI